MSVRTIAGRLAGVALSLLVTLVIVELLAPAITDVIRQQQRQAAIAAAAEQAAAPLDQSALADDTDAPGPADSVPQAEFIERGPGPTWGERTGWGTNTDTILRYWLDGVYDTRVVYNSLGYRGPELPYDKPDDTFRILITGDSFVEAREVAYEDTVYAQLGALLADARTPDGRRIEVFGVGATGWGSLQRYLYYHHEGRRYAPDLVIDLFVMNDVVDNVPRQFYDDRDLDFAVTPERVAIVREGAAAADTTDSWLDRLPPFLAGTNTAALLRQVFDPPREAVTLTGNFTRLHPQTYIYVREPAIDGYAEGWRRTRDGYVLWAREAAADDAQLMVVAVDVGVGRITELSTYFKADQDGWVWDLDLMDDQLAAILAPLDVPLIRTRPAFADYAAAHNSRVYDTLYYVQDGHWNPTGHRVTAQLIADSLREMGVVVPG